MAHATPITRATRTQRLDIRMTPDARNTIVRAANLSGTSLSDYVTTASLAAARHDIDEHRSISLSQAAWDQFSAALDSPDYSALDAVLASGTIWDHK